ncbi:MAG: tetratricopeptide repeat protein [Rhodospirillales bacterium]|nr:tetratricopeptide repeat protein [Alphaproteobacteria bacterium]MBL6948204.1 tetratricopeptide repeat protein [Rhodospirillales bacterium]
MTENMSQDPKSPTPGTQTDGGTDECDSLVQQAREHHMAGRLGEAERLYRQALEIRPEAAEIMSKLGAALAVQGKFTEAVSVLRRAIGNAPDLAEAHNNLGSIFQMQGRLDDAVEPLRRALDIDPNQAAAHANLGNILLQQGRPEDAAQSFQKALEIEPDTAQALNGLGSALLQQNKGEEAGDAFHRALAITPDQPEILSNLGNLLRNQGKYDEAVETLQKAVALQPKLTEAHINLGNALKSRGDWDGAMDAYKSALSLEPDNAETHWNNAQVLLMTGQFPEGWAEYEWRMKCEGFQSLIWSASGPPWDGSSLEGKTILVFCEQGFGDSIQFVRYAETLSAMGGKVIVKCPPQLQALFETTPGVSRAVSRLDRTVEYNVQASLLSLPRLLGTNLDTIPATVPYLTPPEKQAAKLPENGSLKAGIVWAGNPAHKNDQNRSIDLNLLKPLLAVDGFDFYSLQFGERSQDITRLELENDIVDLSGNLEDFSATAAVMRNLDLILSVDTSVVHLAGALGKPVWTLLPFVPDWRWLLGRDDSPWYPSMRLFRQQAPGDWQGVIENVESALRQRLLN